MYILLNNLLELKDLKVNGIYKTEMTEFDQLYVLGDLKHIQKLNNWSNLIHCHLDDNKLLYMIQ